MMKKTYRIDDASPELEPRLRGRRVDVQLALDRRPGVLDRVRILILFLSKQNSDANPIENSWTAIKRKLDEDARAAEMRL